MKFIKSTLYYAAVILAVIAFLSEEVEARRKILQGRKTITRDYYKGTAIPAWSIVVLVGLGMLVLGGIMYLAMRKIVLQSSSTTYEPAMQNDA